LSSNEESEIRWMTSNVIRRSSVVTKTHQLQWMMSPTNEIHTVEFTLTQSTNFNVSREEANKYTEQTLLLPHFLKHEFDPPMYPFIGRTRMIRRVFEREHGIELDVAFKAMIYSIPHQLQKHNDE